MLKKTIDKLIAMHFKVQSDNNALSNLEMDVWSKIDAIREEGHLPWYEKMFIALSVPEFRYASVTVALLFGLTLSAIMQDTSPKSVSQEMGLHIFASNAPYLPSTILEKN